jgi:hypothetical protein
MITRLRVARSFFFRTFSMSPIANPKVSHPQFSFQAVQKGDFIPISISISNSISIPLPTPLPTILTRSRPRSNRPDSSTSQISAYIAPTLRLHCAKVTLLPRPTASLPFHLSRYGRLGDVGLDILGRSCKGGVNRSV